MQRFSLSRVRLIMQNQPHSRLLNNSTALNTSRTRLAATASSRHGNTHTDGEEAWTQYDGLGPVQKGGRDPSRLERSWRQSPKELQSNRSHSKGRRQASRGVNKNSQSRKAAKDTKQPAKSQNRELIDETYLARNYSPITPADFPQAPPTLFQHPKAFLWDHKGVNIRSSFVTQTGNRFRCTLIFTINGKMGEITCIGDGVNKKLAEKTACMHAVHKLNDDGILMELITGGAHHAANDKELLNNERDAKMDVYDYCARFDTVPTFSARVVNTAGHRKSLIEVSVTMPEQNLKSTARAVDRQTADILACVEFKRLAELYHAKHSDEDIVVKDLSNALNSRTAKEFFRYYQFFHDKRARVDCDFNTKVGGRVNNNVIEAQLLLDGQPIGEPVQMVGKKLSEPAAYLTGALALKKSYPEIFPSFVEALKQGNGEILRPLNPEWLDVEESCLTAMTETLLSVRRVGMPRTEEEIQIEDEMISSQQRPRSRRKLDPDLIPEKSKTMLAEYNVYQNDPKLETLRQKRRELPMNTYASQVLEIVNGNEFSIIVGATGSGKTTQVPQIILEDAIKAGKGAACNIICTQPRRIAATSVAQRVAVERNETLQKSVGYHVRFDPKLPLSGGSVLYCTTGILLQQLRHSPDEALDGVTHLVVDEVHERDIMIDYLLIILKRVTKERKRLGKPAVKVVLMSATMDTELFASYFTHKQSDGSYSNCPSLSVPGRTFPVKEFFLDDIQTALQEKYSPQQLNLLRIDPDTSRYIQAEKDFTLLASRNQSRAVSPKQDLETEIEDSADATINWKQEVRMDADGETTIAGRDLGVVPINLAALTLAHIANTSEDGAILVFLPGLDEILKLEKAILEGKPLGMDFKNERYRMYLLHSSIPNQNEVFEDVPPGVRKIILSTNIAETSITIPDVKFVIDTGKLREKQYEQERRITSLVCTWVSKSNSKQRAGRAGRVQNGNYFALFSRARHDSLRATGLPEILRSDLQEICLDIKLQGFEDPIAQFLSEAIEAPKPSAIEASLRQLRALGALTPDEKLTPLGRALATMPIEPSLGKMIILAVVFRCLDPIIILGASSGGRDIFVNPLERRNEAQRARLSFVENSGSDHMAVINAYKSWRTIRDRDGPLAAHRFSERNFLHRGALRTLDQTARQIMDILGDIGIIPRSNFARIRNANSEFGSPNLNENTHCVPLIKALTLAGMYPNIAIATGGRRFRTIDENFTMLHPSSSHYTNRSDDSVPVGTIMTYSQKARNNDGTSILLRENTESTALATLLFGGRLNHTGHTLEIDNWLPFTAKGNVARLVSEFRKCLDRLLANSFHGLYKRSDTSNTARYLADDPIRETFAAGLVEILELDIGKRGRSSRKFNDGGSEWASYGQKLQSRNNSRGNSRQRDDGRRDDIRRTEGRREDSRSRGPFGAGSWR
ncbi:P-loop containing nucleoside triphosphate hydrolase protein [Geopyxis carbonaria]|nr:P-loop containing nucleoside triphosphate hydrolase protein [Geopyxis carbonaria]